MRTNTSKRASSRGPSSKRAGFTLIETILASTLFVGIGYVLIMSTKASEQSHKTVSRNVASNDNVRAVSKALRDELRAARLSTITLDQPAAGNATIRFQTAIAGAGGASAWGVFDRRLAIDEDNCSREGWFIQYAVEQNGVTPNELVRRVIDGTGATQLMHVMARNVVDFTIDNSGDVWGVHWETLGSEGKREDEFDVLIRNS